MAPSVSSSSPSLDLEARRAAEREKERRLHSDQVRRYGSGMDQVWIR